MYIYKYATLCNTLKHTVIHCITLQHTATHCNTLQHAATHCTTMQRIATHCNTLQHSTTHCNTPQYASTHCNTLQHTATNCNMNITKLSFFLASASTASACVSDLSASSDPPRIRSHIYPCMMSGYWPITCVCVCV